MEQVEFYVCLVLITWQVFKLRRKTKNSPLPRNHPRREQELKLYYAVGSFWLLAVGSVYVGKEGMAGNVELALFAVWLVGIYLLRIPKEADVLAYEAAHGPRQAKKFSLKEWLEEWLAAQMQAAQASTSHAQPRAYQQERVGTEPPPQSPRSPPARREELERGSIPWALRELGLAPGATRDEIKASYRRLIRLVHPDTGGDTEFAADLNLARKVLLG